MNLCYLSSTPLKARNFMALARHVTAPGQNISKTGVLELGPTDPLWRFWRFQEPLESVGHLVSLEGLNIFGSTGLLIFAYISCASAHSFSAERRGVPSTPRICSYNDLCLPFHYCERKFIPSLPSTVLSTPFRLVPHCHRCVLG